MCFASVFVNASAPFVTCFGLFLVFLHVFAVQAIGLRGFTSKCSVSALNPRSPDHKHRSPAPKPRSPDPKPRSRGPKTSKPSAKARSPGPKRRRPGPKPRSPDPEPRGPGPKPRSPAPKPRRNLKAFQDDLENWPQKAFSNHVLRNLFQGRFCRLGV